SWAARAAYITGLGLLVTAGIFDETPAHLLPDYHAWKDFYQADAAFVRSVEDSLPSGAMVFQLPYVPYPEPSREALPRYQPILRHSYDHFRGYLHSQTLRWSYGGMKGRAS